MAKVLIVDDVTSFRRSLAGALRSAGYDVAEADDGPTGLEAAGRDKPDLVVVNDTTPPTGGTDLLREIRARTDLRAVPVLMLSLFVAPGPQDIATSLGASTLLVKSRASLREVLDCVGRLVPPAPGA